MTRDENPGARAAMGCTLGTISPATPRLIASPVVNSLARSRAMLEAWLGHPLHSFAPPFGGVASARNLGWKQAAAEVIAFVDSDDLWSAVKIEKQLAALRKGGDSLALVYTWYPVLDMAGCVVNDRHCPAVAGKVLEELLQKISSHAGC